MTEELELTHNRVQILVALAGARNAAVEAVDAAEEPAVGVTSKTLVEKGVCSEAQVRPNLRYLAGGGLVASDDGYPARYSITDKGMVALAAERDNIESLIAQLDLALPPGPPDLPGKSRLAKPGLTLRYQPRLGGFGKR